MTPSNGLILSLSAVTVVLVASEIYFVTLDDNHV